MIYAGNGAFVDESDWITGAANFNTIYAAEAAAKSLNEQGYCSGQCSAITRTVGWLTDPTTGESIRSRISDNSEQESPVMIKDVTESKEATRKLAKESGRNIIVCANEQALRVCTLSWTDCSSPHNKNTVTLKEGEIFYYHDWNGSSCEFKTYEC